MVEMVKDVAAWRDKWFSGVKMKPEPDALEYEMNNLGRTIWGVCWKDNIEKREKRGRWKLNRLGRGTDHDTWDEFHLNNQ